LQSLSPAKVTAVFPIKEKQQLYIILDNIGDINIKDIIPEFLNINDNKTQVSYIGMMNIKGIPVVSVKDIDHNYSAVEEIGNVEGENTYLEC
jgi:ribosomal protein S2